VGLPVCFHSPSFYLCLYILHPEAVYAGMAVPETAALSFPELGPVSPLSKALFFFSLHSLFAPKTLYILFIFFCRVRWVWT